MKGFDSLSLPVVKVSGTEGATYTTPTVIKQLSEK